MDRRGFLQRLGAAAAAFTAARAGVASAVESKAKTTTPSVVVAADTTRFETELERTERMLRGYIKQCRVVSYEKVISLAGPLALRVVYESSDERGPLDAQVERWTADGRIRDCTVSRVCDEVIDVWAIGNYSREAFSVGEPKTEIEVTWLVPSL